MAELWSRLSPDLSPSAPDHLPEHPGREPAEIDAAGLGYAPDRAPRRLWDGALYEIHKRLMAAVDALNTKFGKDTVRCGLFPNGGAWNTRFERRSPAYTTDWRQLMTAQ
jgi:Domain of unknown function (DUF4113)